MRIGTPVLFRNSRCVQSYNWKVIRDLGSLQEVLDSLEEYETDEISITRVSRSTDSLSDFKKDLKIIAASHSQTPISFGGGIRSIEHLEFIADIPVERLVFSSAFVSGNDELISTAARRFGRQAIQCVLPMRMIEQQQAVYHCAGDKWVPLDSVDWGFIDALANEIVIYDIENEGASSGFNFELMNNLPFKKERLIAMGGVTSQCIKTASEFYLAAVYIDNKVLHSEYSIAGYRRAVTLS